MATIEETLATIQNVINSVGAAIDFIVERIGNILADIVSGITATITSIVNSVIDPIISVFDTIALTISSVFDGIVSNISSLVRDAVNFLGNLVDDIVAGISNLVDSTVTLFSDIFDNVVAAISELANEAISLFVDVFSEVKSQIQSIVDSVVLFFTDIFNTVKEGIGLVIDQAGTVVQAVVDAVELFVNEVVNVVGESLRDLLETISNLPNTIEELAQTLLESAQDNIKIPLEAIPSNLIESFISKITEEGLTASDFPTEETMKLIFGQSPVITDPDELQRKIDDSISGKNVLSWFMRLILIPLSILSILGGITSANAEIVLQQHARINPYRLLDPADVVRARHFNLIGEEDAQIILNKTGYDDNDAKRILSLGDFVVPAGELTVWWLRELIDDDTYIAGLRRQGWRDESITQLQQAAFFIPPVQDLITMAVREVFTPDIAEAFGQFEDFPPEFVERAKKVGVSEQVARDYWAAHWSLPSVQMGFEMVHRGVIDQTQLSQLLRASDVMPFWRDKLIEISFSPLTRVDIRRMHREGVLSVEEVNKAYHDIGYNDENAQRLTEFTINLNADGSGDDDAALASLTRSNIIGFFKDGVFDKATAKEILLLTGVGEISADLFLLSAEMDIEADLRKDAISLVIERAKAGVITFNDAQNELNSLGLEELEKQRALNDLVNEQSRRNKLPSRSDLDKMLGASIIDDDTYLNTVQLLGFSDLWASRYLQLIRGRTNAA